MFVKIREVCYIRRETNFSYTVGQVCLEYERMIHQGNRSDLTGNHLGITAEQVGRKFNVSGRTVSRYIRLGDFAIKKHFKYELGCAVTRSICINGGYITAIDGLYRELNPMNLIFVGKDNAILSSGKGCIVLPFALRDEQGYLRVLKELQPDCPRLVVNGRTLSVTIGKEVVYTFSTRLIRADTYGTYGGRQVLCE